MGWLEQMDKFDELKKRFEEDLRLIQLRYYISKAVAAISITMFTIAALLFLFSFL